MPTPPVSEEQYRTDVRRSLPHLIALAGLLLIACHLIWNVGLMHTDDAEWALAAVDPASHPVRDFAVSQGRLWAWPVGSMMLYALGWQGTLFGELLKTGSFVVFFVAFQWLVFVYCGRSIALLSAYLFLGLMAVRWDGSILTAYPLLVWPSGTLAIASILLARAYRRGGRASLLFPIAFALFLSLFENEGITVAIIALFAVALIANENDQSASSRIFLFDRHSRQSIYLWFVFVSSVSLYAMLSIFWSRSYPTKYDGHKFADFNAFNIIRVLFHFTTNGSILHDMISPYTVTFADNVAGVGRTYAYDSEAAFPSIVEHPAALAVGLVVGVMVYVAIRGTDRRAARQRTIQLVTGLAMGLVVMTVPMLPVAMLSKYQAWFFQAGVRAYNGTILAHFGTSLLLAVVGVGIVETVGWNLKRSIAAVLALGMGSLSSLGYAQNANLVADMRHEGARWRVFDDGLALNAASGTGAKVIWAPRFANGSWFTVLPDIYWKQWSKLRDHDPVALKSRGFLAADAQKGLALLDYHLFDDAREGVVTLAHVSDPGTDVGKLKVDRISVSSENASSNTLARLYLNYVDIPGASHQVRLADLPEIVGHPNMRSLGGLSARLDGITLSDQSSIFSLSLNCPDPLPETERLSFTSVAVSDRSACFAGPMLRSGWWAPEPSGVWSVAPTADLVLPASVDPSKPLYADVQASSYVGMGFAAGEQTIEVSVKASRLAVWSFSDADHRPDTRLTIPPGLRDDDGRIHLEFRIHSPIKPSNSGQARDDRSLGILLCDIKLASRPFEERRMPARACGADAVN